jgi:uncharacterized protein (DUF362 family)
MNKQPKAITRRFFIQALGAGGLTALLRACDRTGPVSSPPSASQESDPAPHNAATTAPADAHDPATGAPPEPAAGLRDNPYLAVARGMDAEAITIAALAAIGGIERFVKAGNDVIIKPNICVDYHPPEYAATTNPTVVATLVKLCLGAGARRVRVMDSGFGGTAESAYARSGILAAVRAAGGEMEIMNRHKFNKVRIPAGRSIREWPIYQDALNTDVLINVPIAKHHGLARLTLGGKNLMGLILNRGSIHSDLGQRIADLTSVIRPALTVVDAVRILLRNGPTGGNLDDVRLTNTVIASHDIVAADAYAATLFDLAGADIAYIKAAAAMGLGTLDLEQIQVEEVAV